MEPHRLQYLLHIHHSLLAPHMLLPLQVQAMQALLLQHHTLCLLQAQAMLVHLQVPLMLVLLHQHHMLRLQLAHLML